ncbi:TolC family protein [Telmatocola sphagniphila]|uniref:TolC family protein n=1 Tax=Telmatocola sphagniphila TaxID=1123043 RepID=A0A8E6EW15_9BACT|nr:TolC family protein [Telmatocola sphagniphila]QVL30098.1 TolC family protein [Telmatocola sphagniphila]
MYSLIRKGLLAASAGAIGVGCAQVPRANTSAPEIPTATTSLKPALSSASAQVPPSVAGTTTAPVVASSGAKPAAVLVEQPIGMKTQLPAASDIRQTSFLQTEVKSLVDASKSNQPLTLEYFENLADQMNPIMKRDRAAIDSSKGSAIQAGVMPNPQFNANNPFTYNGRNTTLNAGFTQEIPVMGKKRLDQAAANEATRQAELTYKQNRLSLLAQVRQQYYQVLIDQKRIEVLKEIVEIVKKSYETVEKIKKAGDKATYDVLALKVDYDTTRAKLKNAEAILDGDRKQLESLVGVPGCVTGTLIGNVTGPYPVFDEKAVLLFVTQEHTQIKAAQSVVQQNRLLQRRAEIDPYPNPTIGPAYQFGLVPGQQNTDQFWLNLSFTIPVWDRNQGNIRAARANVSSSIENIDSIRLTLVNQAENLLSQYLAAKETVDSFEKGILADSKEAARLIKAGLDNGIFDFATYLQIQRTAIQANSDYIDALQNLWTNAAQLSGLMQMEKFP